jgi:hypothetical protein
MALWRSEDAPPSQSLSPEEAKELLIRAAELREHVILATPYLSFPCRLIDVESQTLHLSTSLSQDAAKRTLESHPLRLRLPWKLSMVGGPVTFKEHRQWDRRRELLLSPPNWLAPDDQRRHPRCFLVGKSFFTLTREDLQQVRGNIESVSVGGVGIHVPPSESVQLLQLGMTLELGLRLEGGLPKKDAERLEEWLEPRLQETLRRWEARHSPTEGTEAGTSSVLEQPQASKMASVRPSGVLIIGGHLFSEEVMEALEGVEQMRFGPPAFAALKPLLEPAPALVVIQVVKGDLEERYRLRTLWHGLNLSCPLLVLGTGAPGSAQEVGLELRAAGSLHWSQGRFRFFRRMALGLIQKARGDEEEENPGRSG